MPIHIERLESELTFSEDYSDMPDDRFDRLVARVLERLANHDREQRSRDAATTLRVRSASRTPFAQ